MKSIYKPFVYLLLWLVLLGTVAFGEETVLRIGTTNMVQSANAFGDYYLTIFTKISNLTLFRMNARGELVGQLVTGYQVSADNTTWHFEIADDLVWSDGTPLTAADVCFSMEYYARHDPQAGWLKETLVETHCRGNEATLKFNKPYNNLDLEFTSFNILPRHIWSRIEAPLQYRNTGAYVGSGPFYLAGVDLNAGVLTFKKNPYWRRQAPQVDKIEIHLYQNEDVIALALERGHIDTYYKYAGSYPYHNVGRLEKTGRFDILRQMNTGLLFLGFNVQAGYLTDINLRRALSYAIDYGEILKIDALDYGRVPGRGFVSPAMDGYVDLGPLTFDREEAARLLAAAGYVDINRDGWREDPGGKKMTLVLAARSEYSRVVELLQDYLAKVGIAVQVRLVDQTTWVSLKDRYAYDLTITRTTPWGMLMHAGWGTGYYDSRRTGAGVLHTVADPTYLALCDKLLHTTDAALKQKLAREVQEYYAANLPGLALVWPEIVTPVSRSWQGWEPDPLFGIYNVATMVNLRKVGSR